MSKSAFAARMRIAESTVRQYVQRARIKYANAGRPRSNVRWWRRDRVVLWGGRRLVGIPFEQGRPLTRRDGIHIDPGQHIAVPGCQPDKQTGLG
jgi:hypothetical protein